MSEMARDESKDVAVQFDTDNEPLFAFEWQGVSSTSRRVDNLKRFVQFTDLEAAERRVEELEAELNSLSVKYDCLAHDWNPVAVWAELNTVDNGLPVHKRTMQRIGVMQRELSELAPLAELAREIGEAWSASREAFRIIGKRGPLAHNEVMPSESEYAAINNRAYRSIDRAVELHRAAKEATCPK